MDKINVVGAIEGNRRVHSRLVVRLNGFVEALVDQVEKRKVWFLTSFSILYLVITCLLASYKLLWNDELYTFYISRLSSISEIWSVLLTGAEQLPPVFYVITRASLALFGANELAIRLPEVIGFWVMGLCLFRFVSKRTSALYGFLAMLFPLVTGAYYYASEARPYGLVLGFSGLALVCWQATTERDGRLLSLAGLAVSLAAAVSCHYYAVFVFMPLACAEAVRSLSLRRLDLPVWAALSLGVTPLLGFLPLIQRAMGYSSTFWSKSRWMSIPEFYTSLLAPAVLPLMTMVVLSAVSPATVSSHRRGGKHHSTLPLHEMVAAFGFMAIPMVAVTMSMLITGSFTDRYALPAVIGCSVIIACAARSLSYDRPAIAALLALSLCGFFLSLGGKSLKKSVAVREAQTQTIEFLRSEGMSDLLIAVSDQHEFTSLAHYAPQDIASRLVYLADPGKALRYLGHNSVEKGALALLQPWFGLKVEDYARFVATKQQFLVYGKTDHILNWLFSELSAASLCVELRGRNNDALLFLASQKKRCSTGSVSNPGLPPPL